MIYTFITLFLFILGVFTFIPRFKKAIDSYQIGINFFLTLIATLIGVLLAISITNYEAHEKEKTDVIKLLNAGSTSIEIIIDYSAGLIKYYDDIPDNEPSKNTFYEKNPLPNLDYLDTFLTQTIVYRNLSEPTLSYLNTQVINLNKTRNVRPRLYLALLKQTANVFKIEISFQQGDITHQQLELKYKELQSTINTEELQEVVLEIKLSE